MKGFFAAVLLLFSIVISNATVCNRTDFGNTVHLTDSLLQIRCNSYGALHVEKVVRNGQNLDFYFTSSLGDFPLRPGDEKWLKTTLKKYLPAKYSKCGIGKIYCERTPVSTLVVSKIGNNGTPAYSPYRKKPPVTAPLVARNGEKFTKGLYGRHIVLWNSHGLYFDIAGNEWKWQRPYCFNEVEDLFTYNFVVGMLCTMLENAGANVILPRERDLHASELILDNDECEETSGRIHGSVETTGTWKTSCGGFRDYCPTYPDSVESPFGAGTFLYCNMTESKKYERTVQWKGNIPERGIYSVYVSYKTLPESIPDATYTIHRLGGDEKIKVNQKMGGGTWIHVGNYEFDSGEQTLVSLSNVSARCGVVSADAVKIGGGMGNVSRTGADGICCGTSMQLRAYEGARYFLRWSGMDKSVWYQNDGKDDYRDDLMSRGKWVRQLRGELKIPVDLSLAFHTDAGMKTCNETVGTLAIYTLKADGKKTFSDGLSRNTCRELSDFVQTQVVDDIRSEWDPEWRRRQLWNRSYSESRTTDVPAVLLELLSHQNFEDMRYGTDPMFRFTVARSCYKAILKYLSMRYGCAYVVQPLPVRSFNAVLDADNVVLTWKNTPDNGERTARSRGCILYTRIDGGGWDAGEKLKTAEEGSSYGTAIQKAVKKIKPGHIYSFKIVAYNDGGKSFPSEILSVGIADGENVKKARIVNAFTRVSGPSSYCNVTGYGDMESELDSGVPYIRDVKCAGNSFDYPFIHGKALMNAGYSFDSCSSDAFIDAAMCGSDGNSTAYALVDIIFGKQCRVISGKRSPARYGCLTPDMRKAISSATDRGCGIIVSGSYIASDACHNIFGRLDNESAWPDDDAITFAEKKLGYSLHRAYACKNGNVVFCEPQTGADRKAFAYFHKQNPNSYCVESPDAIKPSGKNGRIIMRYADTDMPAAVFSDFGSYRCACFGFPLETVCDETERNEIFLQALNFLNKM